MHGKLLKRRSGPADSRRVKARISGRPRLAGQAGFGLVEVMVSAVLVVIIATATVTSISESQKTSSRTLARGITANLAEQDQERMRAMRASDLAGFTDSRAVDQQGISYQVDSKAEFIQDASGDTVSCTSTGDQTTYLRLVSTVTPQAGTHADPLTVHSIQALPVSQYSPTSGTLITPIQDAAGHPAAGVTVSISGPESRTATTNDKGCAIFQFLTPGAYTIVLDQGGYVDQGLNQHVEYSGTVSPGTINTATPQLYDRWGGLTATFDGATTTKSAGISVFHSGISVAPTTRTYTGTRTAGSLFPFTSKYSVWSGTCAANDPSLPANDGPAFYTAHPGYGQVQVIGTTPATYGPVNLHEPTVIPQVKYKTSATGTPSTSLSTISNGKATVYFKATDAGCALAGTPSVTNNGTANATASKIALPYGAYKACAEIAKTKGSGTNGTYSTTLTGIANTKFNGPSTQPVITIDVSQATNKKSCGTTF